MTRLPFELFLGLRYLKPKRTFVSVITLISLAGVTIGVWVLIVVIAVMSGFDRELREKLMGMHAQVTVMGGQIDHPDQLLKKVLATPHVKAATPFAMSLVFLEFEHHVATPYLKGIDPKREVTVSQLGSYIKEGSLDLDGDKVMIGRELASQYGIFLGDKITVSSPRFLEKKGQEVDLPMDLTVTGIFESGMYEYDIGLIFTSLETAQELYGLGNAVQGIEIKTDDPILGAREVAQTLNHELPPPLVAQTWAQMNSKLLGAIEVEKTTMFIILIFISVVAAFSITSTLITVAAEKTSEIGVLKAVGATPGRIARMFLFQGFVVGLLGTLLGVALGYATIDHVDALRQFLASALHIEVFPKEIYNFQHIPVYLAGRDLSMIVGSAMVIATLGGLLPALWAALLEPVEALRHE
ncbi:MAG TPA: ABC transporter permease [Verrucomicrobiae bacterium]|nr:ABC transporter permease [Verrucomicrobiae bacterium]